ncbi:unnamed protein product [Arabidopsis thaliana]|uniref:FBD domain-containing protein n=1 Tax=Arabidopsis thaliana TaxID=3702 RepID=A0A654G3N9_ARATH|nr:unnamed protein product [Arabidopsis thaliana]
MGPYLGPMRKILLYLPTKKAVSVLSKRWKSLWLSFPGLDFDSEEFPNYNAFVSFMDRFVDFSRERKSCLHKLKLSIQKSWSDQYRITRLESISLPRLKTVHLQLNVYANDAGLESFISSYPAHEDFSIVRSVDIDDNVNVLRVHSQTLTSLSVEFDLGEWGLGLLCFGQRYLGLWIDDPRFKYLNFKHELSDSKTISNLNSSVKVNFVGFYMSHGVGLSKQQMARNVFTGISRVRDLIISADIFIDCYLKEESLPQFCNLSCLKAEVCSSNVKIRETLQKPFESCPNLKSIFLVMTCTNPRALT